MDHKLNTLQSSEVVSTFVPLKSEEFITNIKQEIINEVASDLEDNKKIGLECESKYGQCLKTQSMENEDISTEYNSLEEKINLKNEEPCPSLIKEESSEDSLEDTNSLKCEELDIKDEENSRLEVGKKFESYEELSAFIEEYENTTFAKFWKRDAKLGTAKEQLKYAYLKYSCIFGGQQYRPKGNKKPTRTFKKEDLCPAFISFRVSSDGNCLEIRRFDERHNHETSPENFACLLQQRKSGASTQENVKHLVTQKAIKRPIKQEEIENFTTLKDIPLLYEDAIKGDDITRCLTSLKEKQNADITIFKDESSNVKGIFIQTPVMKNIMSAFPEILAIYNSCKLFKCHIPLFLIFADDGNCQCEIIAVCLLVSEDRESMEWFLNTFKTRNNNWTNTKFIMVDKDVSEFDAIRNAFPDTNLETCIFHVLKIFFHEITCDKMNISQMQRKHSLEILQQLVDLNNEEDFNKLCDIFEKIEGKVYEYFKEKWLNVKHEWSSSENHFKGSFLNSVNYKMKSIKCKLKQIIREPSNFVDFFESLFIIIHFFENERDSKAVYQFQKRDVVNYDSESDEKKIIDFLTHESAKMVINQMNCSKKIKNFHYLQNERAEIHSAEGKIKITVNSCSCNFYQSAFLPCKHMFALRKELNLAAFDINMISPRWSRTYCEAKQRCIGFENNIADIHNDNISLIRSKRKVTVLTHAEKRKKLLQETKVLSDLVALSSNETYLQHLSVIKELQSYWKNGISVRVVPIAEEAENKNCSDFEQVSSELDCDMNEEKTIFNSKCNIVENIELQNYAFVDNIEVSKDSV